MEAKKEWNKGFNSSKDEDNKILYNLVTILEEFK
jgi:hypothetical protein